MYTATKQDKKAVTWLAKAMGAHQVIFAKQIVKDNPYVLGTFKPRTRSVVIKSSARNEYVFWRTAFHEISHCFQCGVSKEYTLLYKSRVPSDMSNTDIKNYILEMEVYTEYCAELMMCLFKPEIERTWDFVGYRWPLTSCKWLFSKYRRDPRLGCQISLSALFLTNRL